MQKDSDLPTLIENSTSVYGLKFLCVIMTRRYNETIQSLEIKFDSLINETKDQILSMEIINTTLRQVIKTTPVTLKLKIISIKDIQFYKKLKAP